MLVDRLVWALKQASQMRPQKQAGKLGNLIRLKPLLTAVAACYLLSILLHVGLAQAAESNDRLQHHDNRLLLDWGNQSSLPDTSYNLSLYRPSPPEYGQWNDMSHSDRGMALAGIAASIVGMSLNATPIGKAILSLREPLHNVNSNLHCSQRFTLSRYFLRCGLKF